MICGAIFDLDGTLLDSMGLWAHLGEHFLRFHGIKPIEPFPCSLQSMDPWDAVCYLSDVYDLNLTERELQQGIFALIDYAYSEQLPLKPDVPFFLEELQERGIRMVVATLSDRPLVEAALRRCHVRSYFSELITCREAGCSKDNPRIFELALRLLGTRKSETLVFEDSSHAAETAVLAGFPVVGVRDRYARHPEALREICDYYLEDFSHLPDFL